ncbi:MAG: SIS domain-containing protein [Gammaproteobacteria bacterium]|nr:SIS domain-containing protein [Gammaproteobacteria bacterium]
MSAELSPDALGVDAAQLARAGGGATAQEVLQQPAVWRAVESLLAQAGPGLAAFLAAHNAAPLILTGAGTSSFIGECLAPALVRAGRAARAVPTTDLVASPASWLPAAPALLVSFARSGNSPESLAALEVAQARAKPCAHLIFTCNREGTLYLRGRQRPDALTVLLPEAANDRGFAMTSSFTGMLLAAATALRVLPADDAHAARLARLGMQVLSSCGSLVAALADPVFERVVYLGSNVLEGLAREAALKMLELTDGRIVSLANTPLGFRHGPKTALSGATLVVVLLSNDDYTRRYDLDLLAELRRDAVAGRVIALAGRADVPPHEDTVVLTADEAIPGDLELCLPYAAFTRWLALRRSLALGLSPDEPNAAGTVTRVVQGVSIYPYGRRR